ncbi:MAG: glycosyltransferase family 2 protein [Bacteroidota bacterium]|nr:glycosyltransferase family 2 protein [Bacteroidota bacterium]
MKLPITAIVLTFNEERNIRDCLLSISDHFEKIYVVDSGSTDNTINIVNEFGIEVINHPFENYAIQRNWCFSNLKIHTDWIINIDADHRVTNELIQELYYFFSNNYDLSSINGFHVSRRTIFMGKWIKNGGHYPVYHAIIFRKSKGICEDKKYDQHFLVEGKMLKLKGDIIDIITDSLSTFTLRHNKWSTLEAEYIFNAQFSEQTIKANAKGNEIEKRRFLREKYYSYPLFTRVFIYFIYRYFIKFGFLDGKEGLVFHFLQGFWFRFIVDAKIYELRKNANAKS